jgi:hypothetical protein
MQRSGASEAVRRNKKTAWVDQREISSIQIDWCQYMFAIVVRVGPIHWSTFHYMSPFVGIDRVSEIYAASSIGVSGSISATHLPTSERLAGGREHRPFPPLNLPSQSRS